MATAPPEQGSTPSPPRHRVRRFLGVLAAIALVLLLAIVGGLLWLQSAGGEARVRALALDALRAQLAGGLEVDAIELELPGTLVLRGLELRTPEGELVARIAELRGRVSVARLVDRTVALREVEVIRPELFLEQDARGLNLMRAIAAREPKAEPSEPGAPWSVRARKLALREGTLALRWERPDGVLEARIEGLEGGGRGRWDGEDGALQAEVTLAGRTIAPLEGPARVVLGARGSMADLLAEVELQLPGLELRGEGGLGERGAWRANVETLRVEPATARILLPGWPLVVPLSLRAQASESRARLTVDARAEAGSARATLQGAANLGLWRAEPLTLEVSGVVLEELLGPLGSPAPTTTGGRQVARRVAAQGASTPLSATLKIEGGGLSLETLEGSVSLNVPVARHEGQRVGPIHLEAHARDGVATIDRLDVQLPGLSAVARGKVSPESLDVGGRIRATSLGGVVRLFRLPWEVQGAGNLDFAARGPTDHPALKLDGRFQSLAWESHRAESLVLTASLPDVRKPLFAEIDARAGALTLAGRALGAVQLELQREGMQLHATLGLEQPEPLTFALAGTIGAEGQELRLRTVSLETPGAHWRSTRPARLSLAEGVALSGLSLAAGPQRLDLDAAFREGRLQAEVEADAVALELLPALAVPRSLQLKGRLGGTLEVRGPLQRPALEAKVKLQGGGLGEVQGVDLSLDGRSTGRRAEGVLGVAAEALAGRLTFDLPLSGFVPATRGALDAQLKLERLDLARTLAMAGRTERAQGTLSGTLKLQGRVEAARASGEVDFQGLTLPQEGGAPLPPLDGTLTLKSDAEGGLGARLEASGLARSLWLELTTPLQPSRLLREPPTREELETLAWHIEGAVDGLPLEHLQGFGLPPPTTGTASLRLAAQGPLASATGTARLELLAARLGGRPPLDATVDLVSTAADTRLSAAAYLSREPILAARARADVSAGALLAGRVGARTPLQARIDLQPVPLSFLMQLASANPSALPLPADAAQGGGPLLAPGLFALDNPVFPTPLDGWLDAAMGGAGGATSNGARAGFDGLVHGVFTLEGTAGSPRLGGSVVLGSLGQGGQVLGEGRANWQYKDRRHAFTATLTSPSGGSLRAEGTAGLDISLPALRKGLELSRTQLAAVIDAQAFSLDFLSGAISRIRRVGGQVDGRVRLSGALGMPGVSGELEWTDGILSLEGLGDYRDGHLRLRGDRDSIVLEDATLKAGGGSVSLQARLQRAGDLYRLEGRGKLDAFPVVYDDQLWASASAKEVTLEGRVSAQAMELTRVHIPDAEIVLPEVRRKELQELERPGDVVLVRNGVPVSAAWRKRLLESRRAAAAAEKARNGAGAEQEREEARGYRFGMQLDAPRNLWVRGGDLNLELGFSNQFRIEYANGMSHMFGEIRVLRGRLTVIGRQFEVQGDSLVRFTGPPKRPFISAAATWTQESEQIAVTMSVRGTYTEQLSIKATSEPAMPEAEIYTLLATGRRSLDRAGGQAVGGSAQAASVVGSLVANQLKKTFASQLPLDVFNLEVGGQEGLQQVGLEAGSYFLGGSLYVGITSRWGQVPSIRENSNTIRAEYQLSPRFSLEGEFGDARAGGLDLIWSNEY